MCLSPVHVLPIISFSIGLLFYVEYTGNALYRRMHRIAILRMIHRGYRCTVELFEKTMTICGV